LEVAEAFGLFAEEEDEFFGDDGEGFSSNALAGNRNEPAFSSKECGVIGGFGGF